MLQTVLVLLQHHLPDCAPTHRRHNSARGGSRAWLDYDVLWKEGQFDSTTQARGFPDAEGCMAGAWRSEDNFSDPTRDGTVLKDQSISDDLVGPVLPRQGVPLTNNWSQLVPGASRADPIRAVRVFSP